MTEHIDQSIDVLRRSDGEYRAKCNEVAELRQRLADAQLEVEKSKVALKKAENKIQALASESEKKQHSLDIVLKELAAKKQFIEHMTNENQRIKRDLENTSRYTSEVSSSLKSKTILTTELSKEAHAPAAMYMTNCFGVGTDPSVEVLRSLFSSSEIVARLPLKYQQLNALCDVFRSVETLNTENWPVFTALDVCCETQEGFNVVAELIGLIPGLKYVRLHGIEDQAAMIVASALAINDKISSLDLPQLCVTDVGFRALMKVVGNREIVSQQGRGELMVVRELDLSQSNLLESSSFGLIRGQAIAALDFTGCTNK